jgi:Kef-type K+ transport system membrane component KefB
MKFLGHPFFLQFCVPVIAVGLSVFLKYVTRRDGHTSFRKEDMAVGMDLAVAAILLFVTASSTIAQQLIKEPKNQVLLDKSQAVPWVLAAFIIGIWAVSTIVRKLGWEADDKLKVFWGIIAPGFFGLSILFFVVNWITQ